MSEEAKVTGDNDFNFTFDSICAKHPVLSEGAKLFSIVGSLSVVKLNVLALIPCESRESSTTALYSVAVLPSTGLISISFFWDLNSSSIQWAFIPIKVEFESEEPPSFVQEKKSTLLTPPSEVSFSS